MTDVTSPIITEGIVDAHPAKNAPSRKSLASEEGHLVRGAEDLTLE